MTTGYATPAGSERTIFVQIFLSRDISLEGTLLFQQEPGVNISHDGQVAIGSNGFKSTMLSRS